jgi:hypothetical protein
MDIADNRKHSDKSWFQFRFKAAFISQTAPAIQKNVPAERKIAPRRAARWLGRERLGVYPAAGKRATRATHRGRAFLRPDGLVLSFDKTESY